MSHPAVDFDECPVCGAELEEHTPASEETYELWKFKCYAEIMRFDTGRLLAECPCENALEYAVAQMNERLYDQSSVDLKSEDRR